MISEEVRERRARELLRELIDLGQSAGWPHLTSSCIDMALRVGLWNERNQRPVDFDRTLPARAVYDPADFEVCRYLEQHYPLIDAELAALGDETQQRYLAVEEPLVAEGAWNGAIFYEAGIRYEPAARSFPTVARVVEGLPGEVRQCGSIMLSRMEPGTHVVPHCGFTNRRLRVHLGLRVPQDAMMRVGEEFLEWRAGQCLVFDDSFEHEVWQLGAFPRVVLLVDIPHPRAQHAPNAQPSAGELANRIAQIMKEAGLCTVEREPSTGEIVLSPNPSQARRMERILVAIGAKSIALNERGDLRVESLADDALGTTRVGS